MRHTEVGLGREIASRHAAKLTQTRTRFSPQGMRATTATAISSSSPAAEKRAFVEATVHRIFHGAKSAARRMVISSPLGLAKSGSDSRSHLRTSLAAAARCDPDDADHLARLGKRSPANRQPEGIRHRRVARARRCSRDSPDRPRIARHVPPEQPHARVLEPSADGYSLFQLRGPKWQTSTVGRFLVEFSRPAQPDRVATGLLTQGGKAALIASRRLIR